MALQYEVVKYTMPTRFTGLDPYNVKAVRNPSKKSKHKILFVFDHIFPEDLQSKKMLSGPMGQRFFDICKLAKDYYQAAYAESELEWMAVPFNQFKTYGKDNADLAKEANTSFAAHISKVVIDYRPDVVMLFGKQPFMELCPSAMKQTHGNYTNHLGTTVPTSFAYKKKTHDCVVVPSLSMNTIFNKTNTSGMYLAGYVARNLVTALDGGKMRYRIRDLYSMKKGKFIPKYNTHFVTNIKDVKAVIKKMAKAKFVSIDTEAQNLYRICNRIQTVQLCCDDKDTYVIPIFHADSPFSGKELTKIIGWLRDYFEWENENKVQIFVNAKFDLNLMKSNFGIRHYKADLWDIQAGEFVFDENMKIISTATGKGYYNLGNLAVQYGCFAFLDNPFGKESRAYIADNPLSTDVLQYCSLDVIVPYLIFKQQLKRAQHIKYTQYKNMVSKMVSDQIHAFSILESSGALVDIEYLFYLKTPASPVNQIIVDREKDIADLPAIKKVNDIISTVRGAPKTGLLGSVSINHFDITKTEHKQILFFDVLNLKPIKESSKVRANGKLQGKIDKEFKKKYESNDAVSAFEALEKAKKIRNSYVNNFIAAYADNPDFKKTKRLRPSYSYQDVVTGRTSASDPNLQQIPSRGALAKYIKRLFIAAKGKILIKVDYSAHEVRGWSIISGDRGVADVFQQGADLRNRYRLVPDSLIAHRIKKEGDVHRINAAFFFGIPVMNVTQTIRDSVKAVIFGLIYQQGDEGLAKSTGRDLKEIVKIKGQFLGRFPVGLQWFDIVKNHAKKHYFVESPLGRRRTLWPLMFYESFINSKNPEDKMFIGTIRKCLRQAVNSPVQGLGSDFMMIAIRLLDKKIYDYYKEHGVYPDMSLNVSVHDSLTVEVSYEWFWLAIGFIEEAMTTGCVDVVQDRYGYDVFSTPEIDFEIGASERDVKKWNFSYNAIEEILEECFKVQEEELGYSFNHKKVKRNVLTEQYHLMPEWIQKQLWANNILIKGMNKNPLSKKERKLAVKYIAEIPANGKLLKKMLAEEEAASATVHSKKGTVKKAKLRKAA